MNWKQHIKQNGTRHDHTHMYNKGRLQVGLRFDKPHAVAPYREYQKREGQERGAE